MTDSNFLGLPVPIGSIDRQLKQLWDKPGGALSRASLVNFAVYCKGAEAMQRNTELLAELMRDHACRALLIGTVDGEGPNGPNGLNGSNGNVQAWINAHCRASKGATTQVCCEQISFLIEGDATGLIPNIVFSHLDSDLPLYLWWQGDLTEICGTAGDCKIGLPSSSSPGDRHSGEECRVAALAAQDCAAGTDLWHWVDRLFFDSLEFSDPQRQFCYLKSCILRGSNRGIEGRGKIIPCDLNWARSLGLRQALAQVFEAPDCLTLLPSLEKVSLGFAPGYRTTALLLAGWLASQLGGTLVASNDGPILELPSRPAVRLDLREQAGAPLNEFSLGFNAGSGSSAPKIHFRQEPGFPYWHSDLVRPDGSEQHHLFPAGDNETLSLLDEELMLGGKHRVYLKALAAAERLL